MPGNQWKLPLNLAIGFHLLVGLSAVYLPDLIDSKPRYEDIYTVSLINMAEPAPVVQPAPPQPAPPPAETPPSEKAVSIAENPVEPAPAPPKAISIKPSKRKIKKKVKPKVKRTDNDALKRQQLAEMLKAQQEAEEQAKILEQEAALERKLMEQAQNRSTVSQTTPSKPAQSRPVGGPGSNLSAVEKQYYTALTARLQSLWSLPEYKNWDKNLSANVVITIKKNGDIADSFFEKKSGDRIFDRFVMKTLTDVGTLPPIPPVLKKQRMEIGLIFSPGRIQ